MPPKIRAILTGTVLVFAAGLWLGRDQIGLDASPILFFGLVALICGAIWLFPEVKRDARNR